jgi:DNA modification methylase
MSVLQKKAELENTFHMKTKSRVTSSALFSHQAQTDLWNTAANENGNAAFRDPAFADNKSLPIHRWSPWIAGYSASFVDDVIAAYLPNRKGALMLDPFCGVGTTLLQANMRGHNAIGFEINPYPALAARTKLAVHRINLPELDAALHAMQKDATHWRTRPAPADFTPPPLKSRLPFFSPKVERQVLHALAFVRGLESEAVADLFRTAFGAVMVSFSNYSYEPSLGSRPAAGKALIEDADVARALLEKLHTMRADVAWMQKEMPSKDFGLGQVINADFFSANEKLESESVDLMMTSPPYMNNYHYVRNTRPQLYWLNFISSPSEQKHLEMKNFGKYWQNVRDVEAVPLLFSHSALEKILLQLRETRVEKGAYGGPGWANYVATYFNDCFRFVAALKRVLAPQGAAVVIIGNSIIQGFDLRTEQILGEIGEAQQLPLEGVYCIREKRVGASITQSSVRQGERSKATLSEFAVVFRQR